jgi:hypothetical protein
METVSQSRLYRLAKRLSVGRFLRYLDLWARYGWRRSGVRMLYIDVGNTLRRLADWHPEGGSLPQL